MTACSRRSDRRRAGRIAVLITAFAVIGAQAAQAAPPAATFSAGGKPLSVTGQSPCWSDDGMPVVCIQGIAIGCNGQEPVLAVRKRRSAPVKARFSSVPDAVSVSFGDREQVRTPLKVRGTTVRLSKAYRGCIVVTASFRDAAGVTQDVRYKLRIRRR